MFYSCFNYIVYEFCTFGIPTYPKDSLRNQITIFNLHVLDMVHMWEQGDLKDSLGSVGRIKQLLISHARHKCDHLSFLSINILVINANVIVKFVRHGVLLFQFRFFCDKIDACYKLCVRDKNINILFVIFALNGIMKLNLSEAFILYSS